MAAFERIVVGLRDEDCAQAPLRLSVGLARLCGAQLTALWVHEQVGYLPTSPRDMLERSGARARFDRFSQTLFELLGGTGVDASAYLLMGSFVTEIPRFVNGHRCNLLVLAERPGRGLLGKIVNFDVALVCRRVRCTVFTVRAEDQAGQLVARLGYAG
jgi:nucleotide-binding universal stress UspA family protein